MDGTLVVVSGTEVLFTQKGPRIIFIREQFWGRAARASGDSRESGRPFYFWGELVFAGAHFSRPSRKVESTNHQLLITASKS
jgi:hypothetical protein